MLFFSILLMDQNSHDCLIPTEELFLETVLLVISVLSVYIRHITKINVMYYRINNKSDIIRCIV